MKTFCIFILIACAFGKFTDFYILFIDFFFLASNIEDVGFVPGWAELDFISQFLTSQHAILWRRHRIEAKRGMKRSVEKQINLSEGSHSLWRREGPELSVRLTRKKNSRKNSNIAEF